MELDQMQKNAVHGVETLDRSITPNEGGADAIQLARTGKKQVLKVRLIVCSAALLRLKFVATLWSAFHDRLHRWHYVHLGRCSRVCKQLCRYAFMAYANAYARAFTLGLTKYVITVMQLFKISFDAHHG